LIHNTDYSFDVMPVVNWMVERRMGTGKVVAALLIVLFVAGCGPSYSEQLAEQHAQIEAMEAASNAKSRADDATRAAKDRCELIGDQSPECLDREYQRHLADPNGARSADSRERERRANVLLTEWIDCMFRNARELAQGAMPAPEAASQAEVQCDDQRTAWVKSQGSSISSAAENAASGVEMTDYPKLLGFIENLRMQR
jgi:hypothetical protein